MNRIYRVVWSTSLGMYQVASEVACSHGKATRSVDRRARRAAVAAAALMAASGAAMAQTVGSVTGYDGQATQLYRGVQDGGQTWDWDGNILSVLVDGTRSVNFTGAFGEIVLDQGVSFRGDTVGALIRTPVGLDSLLTNNGTIIGTATGVSVSGALGRLINNGLIYGDQSGVQSSGTIGLLANYGQIVSGTLGVLNSGQLGTLTNVGTISVNNNVPGRAGVLNQGTISNLGNMGWIGVALGGNEAAISNAGRIDNLTNQTGGTISGDYGVLNQRTTAAPVSVGTITNTGVITGGLVGVYNAGGGITSLSNYGTIDATSAGASVYGLNNSTTTIGGTVYNATLGSIVNGGTITGYGGAIQNSGSIDEIHNLATGRIDGGASGTGIVTGAAGSRIGTINNDSGGVIRGLNAIAIAAGGGTIGTINNAGTIQGNIVNNGSAELTINGDAGGSYGLLTGFDGTSVGSLESPTSNVRFASGNLILNDNVNLGNAFTLLNSGARLHLDRTISVYGNYQQDAGATLEIGVGSGATTTGDRTSDSGYGR
ncbi:ESPR-type extended signal peptide-containing protein, partial [Pandoraea pnomenusa]